MRARTYTGLPAQARIATSSVVHRIVAVARAWLPKEAIDPALQSYHDYLKITRRTPLGDLFDVRGATALRSCGVSIVKLLEALMRCGVPRNLMCDSI